MQYIEEEEKEDDDVGDGDGDGDDDEGEGDEDEDEDEASDNIPVAVKIRSLNIADQVFFFYLCLRKVIFFLSALYFLLVNILYLGI